jgi:F-type H+-transporting ATPase subunit delta
MASVAIRYAKALVDVALVKNQADAVRAELHQFAGMLAESRELAEVMTNPAVPGPQKKSLLQVLAERAGFSITTVNFLNVLVDHHRINIFDEIISSVQHEFDQRLGIEAVQVTTAVSLSEDQKERLSEKLREFTQKEVRLQYQTDPGLIGGLVARIGSTVYDGSIREQLSRVRQQLSGD